MYEQNQIEEIATGKIDGPNSVYYATDATTYIDEATGVPALMQVNENSLADIGTIANDILAQGAYDANNFVAGASIHANDDLHITISIDHYYDDELNADVHCCICDYFPPEELTHYPQARMISRGEFLYPSGEDDPLDNETMYRIAYDAMMRGVELYGALT